MIAKSLTVVAIVAMGTIAYLAIFGSQASSNSTYWDAYTSSDNLASTHRSPGIRLQPRSDQPGEADASESGGIVLFLETDIGPLAVQRN